jgi:hypothetical protein
MNYLSPISKIFNRSISKSLVIYQNNTRLIRNKTKNLEKKFLSEFKEYLYEFVVFLETRRGWWFKLFLLYILFRPTMNMLPYVMGGKKEKMMEGAQIMVSLDGYQKDNLYPNKIDQKSINKMLYSYWINYV